ncbi:MULTISPECIES: prolyl oligopeptidase family serine peptidase [unclassified Streptomyces]|uniref:S9 family peptidase n=1 Tax=unclassified Streptomyces TaxID=2593676 RepID=UPI001BE67BE3|nr:MULTISPECIES: prolyl oligopeptidase family serine peptidase [unclassified Streptomyces]MBT2408167.1 S9 family peptidase [Streptomyces sp. ISL-21]MBT2609275.1 S9 family peptidase [Streptomyces sp. ISL-87]
MEIGKALPYGSWPSPVTPRGVAAASASLGDGAQYVLGRPWWAESRPDEGGRVTVCRQSPDGSTQELLAAPWDARSRVHEYGGGAWTAVGETLVFVQYDDQRLYRLTPGGSPEPITPAVDPALSVRFGDLSASHDGSHVICVRETLAAQDVVRDIVSIPVDGDGGDSRKVEHLAGGSRFVAFPRQSPDGSRLAWISWEHPQMPWDGTELRISERDEHGGYGAPRVVLGSTTESVLQPEWLDDGSLAVISDRSGWWNLYRLTLGSDGPEAPHPDRPEALHPGEHEVGGPLWKLRPRWFGVLPGNRLLAVRTRGVDTLCLVDLATGTVRDLDLPGLETVTLVDVEAEGRRALIVGGGAREPRGLRQVDLETGAVTPVRLLTEGFPSAAYLSPAQPRTFVDEQGREVHAIVYAPHHPTVQGPADEQPPYAVMAHGGPTARSTVLGTASIAFWTSRGVGVLDVNYGGSTGYGREYRERLRDMWGVVDVADTALAARRLAEAGEADPRRLAVQGHSAGGWTVLASLGTTDVFAAGISSCGVTDARLMAEHTHDFESRYLDGLIGPLPETDKLYEERSPLAHVAGVTAPVLLLQGLDDPIVPTPLAEAFRAELERHGVPHQYVAFAGEGHGFRRADTVARCLELSLDFLGDALGFVPAAAGSPA